MARLEQRLEQAGADTGAAEHPPAAAAPAPLSLAALQEQAAQIAQRVAVLQLQVAQIARRGAPAAQQAGAALGPAAAAAQTAGAVQPFDGAPPAGADAAPLHAARSVAAPAPVAAAGALQAPAPAPAPVRTAPPAAFPPLSSPPPAPAVPLRERLPAPLANLLFGGNTLVKIGVLILFLGLAFLLRYSAARFSWPVELRYLAVAAVGALLLLLGLGLRRRRAAYALILQGAGVGVFYLTALAAMKISALLDAGSGFALLFAAALLGAALAVVQNAPLLAMVAALEGFAAPLLASTGANQPVLLFSYLLVLDAAIALIAWFRAWRGLNLIGFGGSFMLASAWAQSHYDSGQYATVQPFLLLFFLLFCAIGLLFARRTLIDAPAAPPGQALVLRARAALRRAGRVDSTLVFGTPVAAFGMQVALMQPWEYGAAWSALAFAGFYLLLGRLVFTRQPAGLALLAEAYAIVGVIFATLAIPLGLEGRWTGAAWAVEAAGMYWLGARQQRGYARAFAFVVFAGALLRLLEATRIRDWVDWVDLGAAAPGQPLLVGTLIGPLLVAAGAFAIWGLHLRFKLDRGGQREALAGGAMPWLGMAALTLLPWQWWAPHWAAAATALLAGAAFALAHWRRALLALRDVAYALQVLALAGFVATLHISGGQGQAAAAACVIALALFGCAAWSMREQHRASAVAHGRQPHWPQAAVAALLAGVALLHLALLLRLNLAQAALLWPLMASVALWLALRIALAPLAALAGVVQLLSAIAFFATRPAETLRPFADQGLWTLLPFAHLGFWTAVVLGLSALLAGAWINDQARAAAGPAQGAADAADAAADQTGAADAADAAATARSAAVDGAPADAANAWCARPALLWAPVLWGLGWWLWGLLAESARVLRSLHRADLVPAVALVPLLLTALFALFVARRRNWPQLGQATGATLAALVLIAASADWGAPFASANPPSAALGWLAWPAALLCHMRLLRLQQRWFGAPALAPLHVLGCWLFVLLAMRECLWQFARIPADWADWRLPGAVLVPALLLWALRSPALLRRWPLNAYRSAYQQAAAAPLALFVLGWLWLSNASEPLDGAPLAYLPLLNPLELAHWLALCVLLLWWRALAHDCRLRAWPLLAQGTAGLTGLALLTGALLRSSHHYGGVGWRADLLYASWPTQVALSITWALCAVAAMVAGRARQLRRLWFAGAALLALVVLKLFLVELADREGLFRIVSFIAVGALLLLVGYFAPVPPKTQAPQ